MVLGKMAHRDGPGMLPKVQLVTELDPVVNRTTPCLQQNWSRIETEDSYSCPVQPKEIGPTLQLHPSKSFPEAFFTPFNTTIFQSPSNALPAHLNTLPTPLQTFKKLTQLHPPPTTHHPLSSSSHFFIKALNLYVEELNF